jgi:hypothetical protein
MHKAKQMHCDLRYQSWHHDARWLADPNGSGTSPYTGEGTTSTGEEGEGYTWTTHFTHEAFVHTISHPQVYRSVVDVFKQY